MSIDIVGNDQRVVPAGTCFGFARGWANAQVPAARAVGNRPYAGIVHLLQICVIFTVGAIIDRPAGTFYGFARGWANAQVPAARSVQEAAPYEWNVTLYNVN